MKLLSVYYLFGLLLLPLAAAERPNIVVILTDDQGYADLGCFGGVDVTTPRLDQMAEEGARLTSFYMSGPNCTPSRAGLMTGSYPRRIDMAHGTSKSVLLTVEGKGLNPEEVTIAEVLGAAGYKTAMFGKWHLGDQPEFLPTRQGFDEFFGLPYSHDMTPRHSGAKRYQFSDLPLLEREEVIEMDPNPDLLTQRITDRAVRFINAEARTEEPFFLYVPYHTPHHPIPIGSAFREGLPEDVQRALADEANWGDRRLRGELYSRAISEIDGSVGQILDAIKIVGIDGDTLVVFTSDNGPSAGSAAPLRGRKGGVYEGGPRVPALVRWPGKIPADQSIDEVLLSMDLLPTFAHLAGGTLPADRIIDGKDIWPVLANGAESPHDAYFYHVGNELKAVRSGKWKLIVDEGELKSLYNLELDIGESNNLLDAQPEVAQALLKKIDAFTEDLNRNSRPAGFVENPKRLVLSTP